MANKTINAEELFKVTLANWEKSKEHNDKLVVADEVQEDPQINKFVDLQYELMKGVILQGKRSVGGGASAKEKEDELSEKQKQELKKLIKQAAQKFQVEEQKSQNSLHKKEGLFNGISNFFHTVGKLFGKKKHASELFMDSAKYGQKLKATLQKEEEQRERSNRKAGKSGPLGSLIKEARQHRSEDVESEVSRHKAMAKAHKSGALERLQAMARGNIARRRILENIDELEQAKGNKEQKVQIIDKLTNPLEVKGDRVEHEASDAKKDMQAKWTALKEKLPENESLQPLCKEIEKGLFSSADRQKLESNIKKLEHEVKGQNLTADFSELKKAAQAFFKEVKESSQNLHNAMDKHAKEIAKDKASLRYSFKKGAQKTHAERLEQSRKGNIGGHSIF